VRLESQFAGRRSRDAGVVGLQAAERDHLGIIVCLFLLRTFRSDVARQQAMVLSRVELR